MENGVRVQARRILLQKIAPAYHQASGSRKQAILEEFVTATGYAYKYVQWLLKHVEEVFAPPTALRRRYGPEIEDVIGPGLENPQPDLRETLDPVPTKHARNPGKRGVCATEQGASDPFALDERCHRFLEVYSKIVL